MDALMQLRESLAERYEIKREIGAGGMATVYLAQDLRHDRPVALKLLNPELGAVLGVERFLSEIRVTANLQHPNLLPLFDSGSADGLLFYVMPFVEGESLRRRLDREKQLPVDEAVRVSVAIANALDYAHSHGVIHRDLKPENILLQANQPVIADFGIALAVSNAGGSRITQTGLSLGTPQYMSPEQATGDRVIDGRSDIYSLGALTYEMLTGEPPHTGNTSQAIIARMLTEKPRPMRTTRSSIPEYVEFAVQHALEKLPADRFSTAGQFSDALRGHSTAGTTGVHQFSLPAPKTRWASRLKDPLVMGLAAIAVASLAFAALRGQKRADERVTRFIVATTDSTSPGPAFPWPGAISPDGYTVVYSSGMTNSLMALRTDELDPRPIPGSRGGSQVIFSPDGEWIAYEAAGKLRKSRLDGSSAMNLVDASSNNGADWTSRDEIILGSEGRHSGLLRVGANGGQLTEFLKPDSAKGEQDYLWPVASSDGKRVVFAIWKGTLAASMLASASTDGGKVTPLGLRGIRPLAIVDEALLYVQDDGAVMAARLNRSLEKTEGSPVPVLDAVEVPVNLNGNSEIFVSRGGSLLTSRGRASSKLAWFGSEGSTTPLSNEVRAYGSPKLSPDEQTIAVTVTEQGTTSIWLYDLGNKTFSKLPSEVTTGPPQWSSTGARIYFSGIDTNLGFGVFVQNADGGSDAQRIIPTRAPVGGVAVAPDEKSVVFTTFVNNAWKLLQADLNGAPKPKPYLNTRGDEWAVSFSPDGKWIAMGSNEGGREEVYVRSYPVPSARIQISAGGGTDPIWAKDGGAVYYRTGTSIVKATLGRAPSTRVIARDTVARSLSGIVNSNLVTQYDLSRSGRFLGRASDTGAYQLIAVPGWKAELERKMAMARRR
jgi:eukaryotic-like serine/threonine-protein kinase